MRYLLFSLLPFIFFGCSSYYKNLHPVKADASCISRIKPAALTTAWFDTGVDVIGKHISGLLLIKVMPDSSTRIVFTNEAGITFFDFEFKSDGTFTPKRVISQLDKKPVIETLRKDFALLLGIPFRKELQAWENGNELYFGVIEKKEKIYFSTTQGCDSLLALETGSKRKRKVAITLHGEKTQPDSIEIKHFTFNMTITLKRIIKDVN